ncbi:MAG: RDD family protein, partial [Betaproteobacteria bacterium]
VAASTVLGRVDLQVWLLITPLLMWGFLWIAFDKRRQGWHDKLAGTVVIYDEDS